MMVHWLLRVCGSTATARASSGATTAWPSAGSVTAAAAATTTTSMMMKVVVVVIIATMVMVTIIVDLSPHNPCDKSRGCVFSFPICLVSLCSIIVSV